MNHSEIMFNFTETTVMNNSQITEDYKASMIPDQILLATNQVAILRLDAKDSMT